MLGAVWDYVTKAGTGERAVGGSTITQQVAKIFFVGNEYSVTRKIREAFLARRIESVLSKEQILELYLNQIFLGRNSYGVQAAARAYFNKDVGQLSLAECAFLAILPKSPTNYDPVRHHDRALQRRNFVLAEMLRNNFITRAQHDAAVAAPLETVRGAGADITRNVGGYFMEEVRRTLVERYGADAGRGPNSVYAGGLWVRTSYNPAMQRSAETALRDGLRRYESGRGWRDPGLTIDIHGDWRSQLAIAPLGPGAWRAAVVLSKEGGSATLGFTDGSTGTLPASLASMPRRGTGGSAFDALRPGAVIAVEAEGEARLGAALDPRNLRRHGRRGGRLGPRPRHAGRLGRARLQLQPRHPGAAPAGLDLQADRLFRRVGQRHDPGLDHHRRPVLRQPGHAAAEMLPQLLGRLCRRADDALGRRAVAQFDDGQDRQPDRHVERRPPRPPDGGRRLSPLPRHRIGRRRHHRLADGQRLRDVRQSGPGADPDPDRLCPGPPRPRHLARRHTGPAKAATRPIGTAGRCRARPCGPARWSIR